MFQFGHLKVSKNEIFYESQHCVGLVNLKPIAPGHTLIVPKRSVARYSELSTAEIADITLSARRVSQAIERLYPSTARDSVWLVQDGEHAGQTVSHAHLHIIPKRYSEWSEERVSRTLDEMKEEANHLKKLITIKD
ncbi:HIT-like domain-containing protein [Sporodiniella umbellata]|nr:HIT-like domain-containing protein [Sporodiniella umbellata]